MAVESNAVDSKEPVVRSVLPIRSRWKRLLRRWLILNIALPLVIGVVVIGYGMLATPALEGGHDEKHWRLSYEMQTGLPGDSVGWPIAEGVANGWESFARAIELWTGIVDEIRVSIDTPPWHELDPLFRYKYPVDPRSLYVSDEAPGTAALTGVALGRFAEAGGFDFLDEAMNAEVIIEPLGLELLLTYEWRCKHAIDTFSEMYRARMSLASRGLSDEDPVELFRRSLRLARVPSSQPGLEPFLSGVVIASRARGDLRDLAAEGLFDVDQLRGFLGVLGEFESDLRLPGRAVLRSPAFAYRGQAVILGELVDRTHSGDGRFLISEMVVYEPKDSWDRFVRFGVMNWVAYRYPSRDETLACIADFYEMLAGPFESYEACVGRPVVRPREYVANLPDRQFFGRFLGVTTNLGYFWDEERTAVSRLRLRLAVDTYRFLTGSEPSSVDDLVGLVLDRPIREPVDLWRCPDEGRELTLDDVGWERVVDLNRSGRPESWVRCGTVPK